jgi:hypothetical protein
MQKFAESKETPILTSPNSTPTHIILALYSYIFEFDYSPSLKPVISPTMGAKAGPPVIEAHKPSDPPYLLTDIQVYILASKLRFAELRARALGRLYAQSVTHNDPMAALEKIYQTKDIELEEDKHTLRSWARAFLSRTHSIGQATNLGVLQKSEQWKSRFAALRLRGGEFLADCDAANEGIAVKTALMKIVGVAKHYTPQSSGSGTRTPENLRPGCDHSLQNPFLVSNSAEPSMYDHNPDSFDFYGLPPLDQSLQCPSPGDPDSCLSSLSQLPPSVIHQLHGYYSSWSHPKNAIPKRDEDCEHDGKRKFQESKVPENNLFMDKEQGTGSGSYYCNKCARH